MKAIAPSFELIIGLLLTTYEIGGGLQRAAVCWSMDGATEAPGEARIISLDFAGELVLWRMPDDMVPQAPVWGAGPYIVAGTAATRFRRAVLSQCRGGNAYCENEGHRTKF
jgi:hypothetical protein